MPPAYRDDPEPAYGWRLSVIEANIAQVRRELMEACDTMRRELHHLETRVTILEVKLALYAGLGGLVGGAASAIIVALVVAKA